MPIATGPFVLDPMPTWSRAERTAPIRGMLGGVAVSLVFWSLIFWGAARLF